MKYSIIIPVYNVGNYLTEALESVSSQTFHDYEAIIVNDGSTDNSEQIIDTFVAENKKFRKININNSGLGAARNKGAAEAKGDYFIFFDSDDILDINLLNNLNETIKNNQSRSLDIIVFDYVDFEGEKKNVLQAHSFPRNLANYGPVAWNKVYSRSFWNHYNLEFPEGIKYEDTPLIHVAMGLSKNSVKMSGGSGYFYRQNRKDSITGEAVNGDILLRFNSLKIMNEFIIKYKDELSYLGNLDNVYVKMGKELVYLIMLAVKNKTSKKDMYELLQLLLSHSIRSRTFKLGGIKSKVAISALSIFFFLNYRLLPGDRKKYV